MLKNDLLETELFLSEVFLCNNHHNSIHEYNTLLLYEYLHNYAY